VKSSKSFLVKEIFYTVQGEGFHIGRPAVFVRFAGCNMWSGRKEDKAKSACPFCDTDFVGGERYTEAALVSAILGQWVNWSVSPFIVLTGGEPALQITESIVDLLIAYGAEIAIETNGSVPLAGADKCWVTLSPKRLPLALIRVDEVKLLFPLDNIHPKDVERITASRYSLQPIDGPDAASNTLAAIEYAQLNPRWRVSIQAHKTWGVR
jgi:7-carboxy-7-deazaguanine synthase (Cx14CxxC type)